MSYEDLLSSYVNLMEKNHDPDVQEEFKKLTMKIGGTNKIPGTFNRNAHLALRQSKPEIVAPIDPSDKTLEQKKERLKASIEAKRKLHLQTKLKKRKIQDQQDSLRMSQISSRIEARENKRKNEEKSRLSLVLTQREAENYGNNPSSYMNKSKGSETMRNLHQTTSLISDDEDEEIKDAYPILTRIINKIKNQMSVENLRKKRNIIDKEPDIGKFKLKEGSIIEYIPTYNNLFNKGKQKVFPLQSLEEIVKDPAKYNHTKKIIQQSVQAEKDKKSAGVLAISS